MNLPSLEWDVVVVGAGPAGSVAARELARRGASVLLVERAHFPRAKVCGCCLNDAALRTLDAIDLGKMPAKLGAIPLQGVKLAAGRREARLPFSGVSLSRDSFDVALRDAAVEAGAAALHGVRAVLGPLHDGWRDVVLHRDGETVIVKSRVVLAANGLAGRLDPSDPAFDALASNASRIGAGVIVNDSPDFYSAGHVFMATGRGGYVGLVRLEDARLDIGASFDASFVRDTGSLAHAAEAVLASVGWPIPEKWESLPWKGTPTLTRRARSVAGPRWFALGDAAGYVEPFTGEGIAWAIQSAVALAPIAQRGVKAWNERLVSEWRTTHARLLRRRRLMCRVASLLLRSPFTTSLVVRLLAAVPLLARPVIAELNRPVLSLPGRLT